MKKRKIKIGKKGDVSVYWIITLVLLVVGFAILLMAYSNLSKIDTKSELCHQSVLYRATTPAVKAYIPLKCYTRKICISGQLFGGKCEEFKNDKDVDVVKASNSEKGKEEIERIYAREILNCWTMMGQGKISIFSSVLYDTYGISLGSDGGSAPHCVVCSRVAISENTFDKVNLDELNVFGYMMTHLVPDTKKTYIEYISGSRNAGVGFTEEQIKAMIEDILAREQKNVPEEEKINADEFFGGAGETEGEAQEEQNDEMGIVFMQVNGPPEFTKVLKNDVLTLAGVSAGTGYAIGGRATFKLAKSALSFVKTIPGAIITGAVILAGIGTQAGSILVNRQAALGYCGDVTMKQGDAETGCSAVRAVKYDAGEITQYCKIIESID